MRPILWKAIGWITLAGLVGAGGYVRLNNDDSTVAAGPETSTPPPTTEAPEVSTSDLDGFRFVDVTAESGIDQPHSSRPLPAESGMTSGAAVVDLDGDGDLEIYLPRVGLPNLLYDNNGDGTFTDIAEEAGVQGLDIEAGSSAAAFADIEGDGDLDLYVTSAGPAQNVLYLNDGTGRFTDATVERGLALPPLTDAQLDSGAQHHGVTFGDVNNDGFLDLLVLQWYTDVFDGQAIEDVLEMHAESGDAPLEKCELIARMQALNRPLATESRSRLFMNTGDGHFSDATAEMGLDFTQSAAFTGQFADMDGDGWNDLLLTGDGCTSRLYRNDRAERFEDVTVSSGTGTDENGMGSMVADFNDDGLLDWFITSIFYDPASAVCPAQGAITGCTGNRLYLNEGNLKFSDATDDFGVRDGGWGWGAAYEDFAGAGRPTLVMTNGFDNVFADGSNQATSDFFESFDQDPMRAWVEPADGFTAGFVEAADELGLHARGVGHGLVAFDYDNDGVLDLLVVNTEEPPQLFRGTMSPEHTSLTVMLSDEGSPGNNHAVGSKVVLHFSDGRDPQTRWVSTDGSYESQKPPTVHFGLGVAPEAVSHLEIFWPPDATGESTSNTVTELGDDKTLVITR